MINALRFLLRLYFPLVLPHALQLQLLLLLSFDGRISEGMWK